MSENADKKNKICVNFYEFRHDSQKESRHK